MCSGHNKFLTYCITYYKVIEKCSTADIVWSCPSKYDFIIKNYTNPKVGGKMGEGANHPYLQFRARGAGDGGGLVVFIMVFKTIFVKSANPARFWGLRAVTWRKELFLVKSLYVRCIMFTRYCKINNWNSSYQYRKSCFQALKNKHFPGEHASSRSSLDVPWWRTTQSSPSLQLFNPTPLFSAKLNCEGRCSTWLSCKLS